MASMQEVGTDMNEVFGDQATRLTAHVEMAVTIAQGMEAQFVGAVQGTTNEQARALSEELAWISSRLGEIATRLGTIQAASQELLASWRISVSGPVAGTSGPLSETQPALSPEQRKIAASSIDTLLDGSDLGVRTIKSLRVWGYESVRDLIAAGKAHIGEVRNFADKKMEWLEGRIGQLMPGQRLPERADPTVAARLYPSLREVPLQVINNRPDGTNDLWRADPYARPFVYDVLTRPANELFRHKKPYEPFDATAPPELSEAEMACYEELRQKAAAYAKHFEQAKREL